MTFTKCANIFQNLKVLIYKGFNISAYRAFLLYRRYFGHFSEENFFMNFHRIPLAQIQIHLRKIQKLKHAVVFTNRYELWKYTLELLKRSRKNLEVLNGPRIDNSFNGGVVLEFGVFKGESINALARLLPNTTIYGFDSFLGLQEDWYGRTYTKGHFNLFGVTPIVEKNVMLIPGWFEETLPEFLDRLQFQKIDLLHMDADTYTPTNYVLKLLGPYIRKGTIIIFDEYFGYSKSWKHHEYKAFQEFCDINKLDFRYLALTNIQVAIEIL